MYDFRLLVLYRTCLYLVPFQKNIVTIFVENWEFFNEKITNVDGFSAEYELNIMYKLPVTVVWVVEDFWVTDQCVFGSFSDSTISADK